MILRDINVGLDSETIWLPKDYDAKFGFRQRYIGNYLRRLVHKMKWTTTSFRSLSIEGHLPPGCTVPSRVQFAAALVVPVHFDQPRYDNLGPGEHHEFFLGMYTEGIEKAHRDFPIPYDVLMKGIEDFRQGGYKNEWVQQRKLLKPFNVHASLLCDMDSERFQLTLLVERKGVTLYREPIFTTKPDEIMYDHKVKDVIAVDNKIVVRTKMHLEENQTLFTLDLATIA